MLMLVFLHCEVQDEKKDSSALTLDYRIGGWCSVAPST